MNVIKSGFCYLILLFYKLVPGEFISLLLTYPGYYYSNTFTEKAKNDVMAYDA